MFDTAGIRARAAGLAPIVVGLGVPPSPGMGGTIPGLAPGVIPAASTQAGIGGRPGSALRAGQPGTVTLVMLGALVLALVGFNVSTRAFQA